MIHNPGVNSDLEKLGVKFMMDTSGKHLIEWTELSKDDIVIIPAFGTTLEIEKFSMRLVLIHIDIIQPVHLLKRFGIAVNNLVTIIIQL